MSFFVDPDPTAKEFSALLEQLHLPTLVMHGTADRDTPFEAGQRVAAAIAGAQFYPFEGRCHLCMLTAAQEFCDALRDFVKTGSAPRSAPVESAVEDSRRAFAGECE